MNDVNPLAVQVIGFVRSPITSRNDAPKFGSEGAPDAWLEIDASFAEGLAGINAGADLVVLTWFHQSHRNVLKLHPRWDKRRPLTGVFATRSPDRPNPIGLHRVTVREIMGSRLKVGPLEAIDGTPVVDIKPAVPKTPDPETGFLGTPPADD